MCAQSCLTLCDPWTIARQAPLSKEFSRQEYWSVGCHFLFHLPDPGIKPTFLASPALAGRFFTTALPGNWCYCVLLIWSAWLPGAIGLLLLPLHASWGRWRAFSRMDPTWYFFVRKRISGLWRWGELPRLGTWGQTTLLGNGEHFPGGAQVVAGCTLLRPPVALSDGGHSQASGEKEVSWTEHLLWWNLPRWSCLPASVSLCKGTELHPQWQKECLGYMSIVRPLSLCCPAAW